MKIERIEDDDGCVYKVTTFREKLDIDENPVQVEDSIEIVTISMINERINQAQQIIDTAQEMIYLINQIGDSKKILSADLIAIKQTMDE